MSFREHPTANDDEEVEFPSSLSVTDEFKVLREKFVNHLRLSLTSMTYLWEYYDFSRSLKCSYLPEMKS
jgi:hypothetical protein